MNTIVSFCHFCEIHGPIVLFCTQEIFLPKNVCTLNEELLVEIFLRPDENFETLKKLDKTNFTSQKNSKQDELCDACQSFKNVTPGYQSRDEINSRIYLSTQYLNDDATYKVVRQICFQSISCEQYPGQIGPMFFGDEEGFYTFSFKFPLKDFHSRGFKRNYSINIISKDRVYLLNSWDFFSKNLEGIVSKLKNKAENCFVREHECHGASVPGKLIPLSTSSSFTTFHLKNGKQQRVQNQTRSLCDITGNTNVFANLHQFFVLLIKTNNRRLKENILSKSDHNFIDLNKVEETEEGFVKLFSRSWVSPEPEDLKKERKHSVAIFTHLRSIMKVLGLSTFMEVLYHVVIGTQILIRAQDEDVIKSVIDCLKTLLPDGCKNIAYYTTDYDGFDCCNFIGMPLLPLLPSNLKPCLLIDISGVHTLKKIPSIEKCSIYECLRLEIEELLLRYYMVTFEKIHLPNKIPTLLENIQKIILNDCLDDSVVDLCLASLREDWFNKAKAYYAFTKGGQRSKNDVEKLLQVLGARNEDKIVLTFWMTALFPKEIRSE